MEAPLPSQPDHPKEDITLTNEETKRLEECFRDKEFRDLLGDYVQEISNPSTKMAYDEYLRQLETEGGAPQNRKLMKPIPVFCIKAKLIINYDINTDTNSKQKKHIFINICCGKLVDDAKLTNSSGFDHKLNSSGSKKAGLCWQIPYILGHKRFDSDGSVIYDVAFSDNTIKLLNKESSFKNTVVQTALEAVNGIQNEYPLNLNNKKYKILSTNKHKGRTEPPLMSVFIPSENDESKRMININEMEKKKKKEIKYKIVESAKAKSITDCWSDNTLNESKGFEQIYIKTKLENVKSIEDIDIKLNKEILCITIKNNKYKKCEIDLKQYNVISSSINASWNKEKKELKIIFKTQKKRKIKMKKKKEIIISNNDESSFLLKEIKTKRIVHNDDIKQDLIKTNHNNNTNNVPLCHHKIPMKLSRNGTKSYWVCSKSQNDRCTAFIWNKEKKRLVNEFEIEKREKIDKIVLLIRMRNIIKSSVNIDFKKNGEILIEFETNKNKYHKNIEINHPIDVEQSKYDLNYRNLLIMVYKQEIEEENNTVDTSIDHILNDSILFEID